PPARGTGLPGPRPAHPAPAPRRLLTSIAPIRPPRAWAGLRDSPLGSAPNGRSRGPAANGGAAGNPVAGAGGRTAESSFVTAHRDPVPVAVPVEAIGAGRQRGRSVSGRGPRPRP